MLEDRAHPASASGGNSTNADLEQVHGSVEVLEPMTSEISLRLVFHESGRRGGDDDLAAVRESPDPRTTVHVDPDVAFRGRHGSPRVQAHAHRDRARPRAPPAPRSPRRLRRPPSGRRRRTRHPAYRPPHRHALRTRHARRDDARRAPRRNDSAPSSFNRRVEPSMSVKRNVTVPAGKSLRTCRVWTKEVPSRPCASVSA